MANRMGICTLIIYKDLQKVYTLNKYNFLIFIYNKETMKILVIHINKTFCEYLFLQYIDQNMVFRY